MLIDIRKYKTAIVLIVLFAITVIAVAITSSNFSIDVLDHTSFLTALESTQGQILIFSACVFNLAISFQISVNALIGFLSPWKKIQCDLNLMWTSSILLLFPTLLMLIYLKDRLFPLIFSSFHKLQMLGCFYLLLSKLHSLFPEDVSLRFIAPVAVSFAVAAEATYAEAAFDYSHSAVVIIFVITLIFMLNFFWLVYCWFMKHQLHKKPLITYEGIILPTFSYNYNFLHLLFTYIIIFVINMVIIISYLNCNLLLN